MTRPDAARRLGWGCLLVAVAVCLGTGWGSVPWWWAALLPAAAVAPIALLWSPSDRQAGRAAQTRLYDELAQSQEPAADHSFEASASIVVTATARLLTGSEVELVLLSAEGPVSYVGDAGGLARLRPSVPGAFEPPWALRALGESGVAIGTEEARPWLSAVIGTSESPRAVLRARRPAGADPFGRQDVRLVGGFVVQADAWLSEADLSSRRDTPHASPAEHTGRAGGDVGAATAPALTVLRDSADRLARLAETPDGVEHIVEELHHVEQAVASLLGAVALSAEPDLMRLPEPDKRPRADSASDWTTTGVLQ